MGEGEISGPCKGCGATNYGLSTSGPDYCGECACGVDPRLSKQRREYDEMFTKYCALNFALGIVTGHFPPFNDKTREIGEACLAQRKDEWEVKQRSLQSNPHV